MARSKSAKRRQQVSSRVRRGIFFSRQLKNFIVDSRCCCGHLESQHGSCSKNVGNKILREAGHGNCCCGDCKCQKFTWKRYVTADEMAEIVIANRSA